MDKWQLWLGFNEITFAADLGGAMALAEVVLVHKCGEIKFSCFSFPWSVDNSALSFPLKGQSGISAKSQIHFLANECKTQNAQKQNCESRIIKCIPNCVLVEIAGTELLVFSFWRSRL